MVNKDYHYGFKHSARYRFYRMHCNKYFTYIFQITNQDRKTKVLKKPH